VLRYLETYFRHRFLLTLPVFVGLAIGLGIVLMQPRSYQANVSLWFDRTPLSDMTIQQSPYVDLSVTETNAVTELLATRTFSQKVGERSGLTNYLASHSSSGGDPVSKVTRLLSGGGGTQTLSGRRLDDAVYQLVKSKTKVTAVGPQVVSISFTHADPVIASSVAQGVSDQFTDEMLTSRRATAAATVDFYQKQVAAQNTELTNQDAKINDYLNTHPDQRLVNAVPDATLTQLRRTDDLSRQRYQDLLLKLDQAQLASAAVDAAGAEGFHTIDRAQVPDRPISRTNIAIEAIAGGGIAGALLMVLGVVLLTVLDAGLQRVEEVEPLLGLKVVGAVPQLRRASR
jgi:uncharacterized protein involved in exopolysaccharide biosynthesis